MSTNRESSRSFRRVGRPPRLSSLQAQQRTLGNRAVLRLIGVEKAPVAAPEPVVSLPEAEHPAATEPRNGKWLLGGGALAAIAALEALRRWAGN